MKRQGESMSAPAQAPVPIKVKEYLPVKFTEDELRGFSRDLARKVQELASAQDEKKAAMSQFNTRVTAAESEINDLSRKINNGYEHRNVEVEVKLHTPAAAQKTFTRVDTGEVLRVVAMTQTEMQENLPFGPAQTAEGVKTNAEGFFAAKTDTGPLPASTVVTITQTEVANWPEGENAPKPAKKRQKKGK